MSNNIATMHELGSAIGKKMSDELAASMKAWVAANPDYVEVVTHPTPYEKLAGVTIDGKVLV